MLVFCTLFDSFYLTKGLAMYRSLEKNCSSFHLYIFAFDDQSHAVLKNLALKYATIVSLSEFEDKELLTVKPGRSKAEYCWTCTSSTILYIIEKFKVTSCTYLDADMYFYRDPKVLFEEMGQRSVLITEHRYPAAFDRSSSSGKYCVQFITFRNDENGMKALKWWRNACIEWCYDRYEDGKFGDQKYLDDWTTRFSGVHVLQHPGGGVAAWNVEQYRFVSRKDDMVLLSDKKSGYQFEVVFFHFHHVRFFLNDLVDLGWREPANSIVLNLYAPYFIELANAEKSIKAIDSNFNIPLKPYSVLNNAGVRGMIKYLIKVVFRYSLYNSKKLIAKYRGE